MTRLLNRSVFFLLFILLFTSCMNPYRWTGERATMKGQTKQNAYYKKAKKFKHDESWH